MAIRDEAGSIGAVLRLITGVALLASAVGTVWDEFACGGCTDGSLGLIPLYIGFPIGAIGLVLVFRKVYGWLPALIMGLGVAGILYFMFSYPEGAVGWAGALLIGVAHLFLPLSGRFIAVFWWTVGILGFPEFRARPWGVIDAFLLFGVATALTGVFVLWALRPAQSEPSTAVP